MAIKFDAGTCQNGDTNSLSWSHTCSADASILVVIAGGSDERDVTGVSYGGQSLTHLNTGTNVFRRAEIWYLKNPPSGANTVTVSYDVSGTCVGGAMSFEGVNDIDNSNSNCGSSATGSISISNVSGHYWACAGVIGYNMSISCDAGQTQRYDLDSGKYATNGATDQDGSFSWSLTRDSAWCAAGARLVPNMIKAKVSGAWKGCIAHAKVSGVWKDIHTIWVKDAGAWKKVKV